MGAFDYSTVSPLLTNLQVANFQRCARALAHPVTWVSSRVWLCTVAWVHPPRVAVLFVCHCAELYRQPQCSIFVSNPGCPEARVNAAMIQLVPMYFPRYCVIRLNMLNCLCLLVFFVCYLCGKQPDSWEVKLLNCVQIFAVPWTVAYQPPPSMEFSRQE